MKTQQQEEQEHIDLSQPIDLSQLTDFANTKVRKASNYLIWKRKDVIKVAKDNLPNHFKSNRTNAEILFLLQHNR